MILNEIVSKKRRDLAELKSRFPMSRLKDAVRHQKRKDVRSFKKALSSSKKLNLICEIKKASPSEGVIREDFQPLRIASYYEHAGAAAISVLTETHFFKGRPSYLKTVRQVTKLPILRKDFIFETYQVYESALLEADAFLLIASLLTDTELKDLVSLGYELGMEPLVEVHADEDLKKALDSGVKVIGINNRNLTNLSIDLHRAKRLIPHIPKDKVVVVESGIHTHSDLMEYKSFGITSFLVGTSIMKSKDMVGHIKHLLGEDKKWKGSEETHAES